MLTSETVFSDRSFNNDTIVSENGQVSIYVVSSQRVQKTVPIERAIDILQFCPDTLLSRMFIVWIEWQEPDREIEGFIGKSIPAPRPPPPPLIYHANASLS